MKKYLCALSVLLSGCMTVPETNFVYNPARLVVIAEVCTTIKAEDNILNGIIVNRENIFSSSPYSAILTGTTIDNKFIYRSNIAAPDMLTYFTINTPTKGKFIFKRDYKKYQLNQWSAWEKPDSLIDDNYHYNNNEDYPFFWLATRYKDRTGELKKLPYNIENSPKVRFKIMHENQYDKENFNQYNRQKMVLEHNLPRCE